MASPAPFPPQQPPRLRLGVTQTATLPTLSASLAALAQTAARAAEQAVDVLLFPEAYLGGYPRGATFGATVGARDDVGREQFLQYWRQSVDLGDATAGAAEAWLGRGVAAGEGAVTRQAGEARKVGGGDGTREELERVARETGVFLVVGLVERAGGTLYCSVVYVCPRLGGKICYTSPFYVIMDKPNIKL
jgi:nitrilase